MMAFFMIKKRETEAMVVMLILVFSTLFTVASYEEVYDLSKISEDRHACYIKRETKKMPELAI